MLKINAPMTFGMLYLGSAVADFMARYADLTVELTLNDRFIDPSRRASTSRCASARCPIPA